MKLHKLLYYCQAWSLVWDEMPLYQEPIEAWANGPVVRSVWERHRGQFIVSEWEGDAKKLNDGQVATVDGVLGYYGPMTAQQLSDLTHAEIPWRQARGSLRPGDRSNEVISLASMHEFYSSLPPAS